MRPRANEHGTALVLALLVAFILSLLGISFLVMAATESRIAENERRAAQALYAAEAGARAVKRWFDRPGVFFNFPTAAVVELRRRRVLDEDDPYGPGAQLADGASVPYYKQAVDLDGDGADDLFRPPYRGDLRHKLMGTEDGPDMIIDDEAVSGAPDGRPFLEQLSTTLFGADESPVAPRVRISRIEIYAPPYLQTGTRYSRYGIGTVKVTARLYRPADLRVLAERQVRGVLNEVPYRGPYGPLHSCGDLAFTGLPLTVRWGAMTATGRVKVSAHDQLPASLPRRIPPTPKIDALAPSDPADFEAPIDGSPPIADPWLRVLAAGQIEGAPAGTQPYAPLPPPNCCDHSDLVQDFTLVGCPGYDYETWKMIAGAGGSDTHYYAHAGGTTFRENGTGDPIEFETITRDARGLYFFDTTDALAPHDANGDGVFDNLTPEILLSSGEIWAPRAALFLNASRFKAAQIVGSPIELQAPGEPFHDADLDGRFDAGEGHVNLDYPSSPFFGFAADSTNVYGGGAIWNSRGPATAATPVSLHGILYTSGMFEATGAGTFYGSVIARSGVVQEQEDGSLPTPDIFWDESIVTGWPPEGSDLPRVHYTRWATEP